MIRTQEQRRGTARAEAGLSSMCALLCMKHAIGGVRITVQGSLMVEESMQGGERGVWRAKT